MRHVQSQCAARVHVGASAPTRTTRTIADGFPRAPRGALAAPRSRRRARDLEGVRATAYVVNTIDGTVTPVDTAIGRAAGPLNVGAYTYPTVITITGQTAVVVEPYGYTVELINLKTRHVLPPDHGRRFPDGRRDHRLTAGTGAGPIDVRRRPR